MTEKIKTALVEWAELVIKDQALWENDEVHLAIQKLYEISVCQKFLNQGSSSSERWKRQQEELSSILNSMTPPVPEILEKKEDLEVPPMMETIKNMVIEMPDPNEFDPLFDTPNEAPVFFEKVELDSDKKSVSVSSDSSTKKKNLNDQFAKIVSIDLNDRIAFVKYLFEENASDYERVLSQISTYETWEEVQNFIYHQVKSEYTHWEEKPELEARFFAVLQKHYEQ